MGVPHRDRVALGARLRGNGAGILVHAPLADTSRGGPAHRTSAPVSLRFAQTVARSDQSAAESRDSALPVNRQLDSRAPVYGHCRAAGLPANEQRSAVLFALFRYGLR